ncbi:MAG: helix-turn-helix transcriptional regulator [Saprospiraceae bacterium]|nr:helix-turn-helix transcriptional regulator [Saprospiraceae bacterium]
MKGLRSIPRILKINNVNGYSVSLLFNNGESRIIDFNYFIKVILNKKPGKLGYELIEDKSLFKKIKVIGTTVGWKEIGRKVKNIDGVEEFLPYDLDPLMIYNNSVPDDERNIIVGMKIRSARIEAGLTQEQLAHKSGTSKHYISRLENNKSDIELLTLKKIVEAGLGKKLSVEIS